MVRIFTNFFIGMAICIIVFEFVYFLSKKKKQIPPLKYLYLSGILGGMFAIFPTILSLTLNINLSGNACNIFFFNCYIQEMDNFYFILLSKMLNNVIGGMSISLMLFELMYLYNKKIRGAPSILYFYFFSFSGVIISLIPSLLRFFLSYEMPEFVCNMFFFNCLIQKLDPTGSEIFSFIFFFLFFITTIIVTLLIKREKPNYMLPTID
ncbi:MAG: hypothetical protein QXM68_02105 [Candidatus Aenigmatarchaeota archaeon]|nr:hypothetical protein [Candidatus Aenigmarchaeota archaeon]